jgi:hypothetical protein
METRNSIRYLQTLQRFIEDDFTMTRKAIAASGLRYLKSNSPHGIALRQMISELQQQDIINQRIEHLIEGLVTFPKRFSEEMSHHAFRHLQSLQLMAIGQDLERTVTNVRNLAATFAEGPNGTKGLEAILFTGHIKAILVMDLSHENILMDTVGSTDLQNPPLNDDHVNFCRQLYTTTSERTILQLFQCGVHMGKPCELLLSYQAELQKISNESVQLF